MAKSKPIGVRFDDVILERIKTEQGLKSPQQVLNWLLQNYIEQKEPNKSIVAARKMEAAIVMEILNKPTEKQPKPIRAITLNKSKEMVEPKPGTNAYFLRYNKWE